MKLLVLAVLVAVASADFQDDTFHFASLGGVSGGLQNPLLTKKYASFTPAYSKQYTTVQASPVYSSLAQPAYGQQYVKQISSSPLLVKSVEHEIPVYHHHAAHHFAQPLYAQQYSVKQIAQPAYAQYNHEIVQPFVSEYKHEIAQPVLAHYKHEIAHPFVSQYKHEIAHPFVSEYKHEIAQPVLAHYKHEIAHPFVSQYKHEIAQPVLSQYSTLKKIAQPVYAQQYSVKQISQPAYAHYNHEIVQPFVSQYKHAVAQPVVSQYSTLQKIAQPTLVSQYAAKPLEALSGVSTYAAGYSGPQHRILSQEQVSDANGAYKTSYATENGIQHVEQGALVEGAEGAAVAAQGSYSYTGPDGQVYTVNYVADENGFRAAGDHLPTPPPVPAEIARSLQESSVASSERYDEQGKRVY